MKEFLDKAGLQYFYNKIKPCRDTIHYVTNPSGTVGSTATDEYNRTQWAGSVDGITTLYTGLTVLYKIPIAGVSRGVTLNINNLGEHPVVRNVTTSVSTSYAVDSILILVYDADQVASVYVDNTSTEYTGCWKIADLDTNTTYSPVKLGFCFGSCTNSASIVSKTVSMSSYSLVAHGIVCIRFTKGISVANATLNINSTGAKSIYYKGAALEANVIKANDYVIMQYNSQYHIIGILRHSGIPQTDLDSDVQQLLNGISNKANSADLATVATSGSYDDLSNKPSIPAKISNLQDDSNFLQIPNNQNVFVDMGLPSGTLWATCDIDVTKPNGFCETPFVYEKSFFSWGNIDGHNPTSDDSFAPYDWGGINEQEPWYDGQVYGGTQGNTLTGNIAVGEEFDAARANLGAPWRMPTSAEYDELFANIIYINADGTEVDTNNADKRVTVNGIVGLYIQSNINGARLFFSCSGNGTGTSRNGCGSFGNYWSTSVVSARNARSLSFTSSTVSPHNENNRYSARAVRAVLNPSSLKASMVALTGSYDDLTNKPTIPQIWRGTQAQYDALSPDYDSNTIYIITAAS